MMLAQNCGYEETGVHLDSEAVMCADAGATPLARQKIVADEN